MGNLVDRIGDKDEAIGASLRALLAAISSYSQESQMSSSATGGMRGVFQSKLEAATFRDDKDDRTKDRYVFTEAVFGVLGGSARALSHAQCHGTVAWLGKDGNDVLVPRIVAMTREIIGQDEAPLSQAERAAVARAAAGDTLVEAAKLLGAEVRPVQEDKETMGKDQKHWLDEKSDTEEKFLGFVRKSGVDKADMLTFLKGEKVERDAAETTEKMEQLVAGLSPQKPEHGEANVVVFSDMYTPAGVKLSVTARQGATADDIVATAAAWDQAAQKLAECGWRVAYGGNGYNGGRRQQPAQPPAPPAAPQPQDPAPAPQAQRKVEPPVQQQNGNSERIDTIKIRGSKDKPAIEFWRTGRKFAELFWHLGASELLNICPQPFILTEDELNDVGSDYQVKLKVNWEQSPKNEKWKDIVSVEIL